MKGDGVSEALRMVATASATFFGGTFALYSPTSTFSQRALTHKKKKYGKACVPCSGIGFSMCKLCKGNGTIMWSPLFDPVIINPCLCPTCDGGKVQLCLNCLGDCRVL